MKEYIVIFEHYGSEIVRDVVGVYSKRIDAIGHTYDDINNFLNDHKSSMKDYELSTIQFDNSSGYEFVDLTIQYDDIPNEESTWWIYSTDEH